MVRTHSQTLLAMLASACRWPLSSGPRLFCLACSGLLVAGASHAAAITVEECRPRALHPQRATELTLQGARLGDLAQGHLRLWTSVPANVERIEGPAENAVTFRITPERELMAGEVAIQAHSPGGVSDLLWLAVDAFPTVVCQAGSGLDSAQTVPFPCAVDGKTAALQRRYYRFRAEAGQTVSVEVVGERFGSDLDAVLILRDAAGRELAYADDNARGADPYLSFVCRETGFHVVELHDIEYRGGLPFRLRIGEFPVPVVAFPAGVRIGHRQRIELFGPRQFQLTPLERLWESPAGPTVITAPVAHSPGLMPGATRLILAHSRQFLEHEPNGEPSSATPITLPAGINGRFQAAADVDVFTFHAAAGQWFTLRPTTRAIGSTCSTVLRVTHQQGDELASSGDGFQADAPLSFRVPAAGNCFLTVSNLLRDFGPAAVYHLDLVANEPPLEIHCEPLWPTLVAVPGGRTTLKVRRRGFPGPVRLAGRWIRPAGALPAGATTMAKDKAEAAITLEVPEDAVPGEVWSVAVGGEVDLEGTTYTVRAGPGGGLRSGSGGRATVAILQRPLTLAAPPERILLAAGGEASAKLRLLWNRSAVSHERPLQAALQLEGAPAGCQLKQPQQVDHSQQSVDLLLSARPDTPPGTYPEVRLVAHLDYGGRRLFLPGPQLTLEIAPPAADQAAEKGADDDIARDGNPSE